MRAWLLGPTRAEAGLRPASKLFEGRGQIRPRCRVSGKRTAISAAIVGRPRPADRDERTQAIADSRSEQRDKAIDRMIQAAKACSARAKLRSRYYAREFDREPSRFRNACPWISVGDMESHSQPRSRGGPRHRTSRPSRRSAPSPRSAGSRAVLEPAVAPRRFRRRPPDNYHVDIGVNV